VTLLFHSCRILFGADRKSYFPFPSRSVSLPPAEAIFPAADFRKGNKKELAGVCEAEENAAAQRVNVAKEMSGRQCRWEKRPHEKPLLSIFAVSVRPRWRRTADSFPPPHNISRVYHAV